MAFKRGELRAAAENGVVDPDNEVDDLQAVLDLLPQCKTEEQVNDADDRGFTAMMAAARGAGDGGEVFLKILRAIWKRYEELEGVDLRDVLSKEAKSPYGKWNVLQYAAKCGCLENLKYIVSLYEQAFDDDELNMITYSLNLFQIDSKVKEYMKERVHGLDPVSNFGSSRGTRATRRAKPTMTWNRVVAKKVIKEKVASASNPDVCTSRTSSTGATKKSSSKNHEKQTLSTDRGSTRNKRKNATVEKGSGSNTSKLNKENMAPAKKKPKQPEGVAKNVQTSASADANKKPKRKGNNHAQASVRPDQVVSISEPIPDGHPSAEATGCTATGSVNDESVGIGNDSGDDDDAKSNIDLELETLKENLLQLQGTQTQLDNLKAMTLLLQNGPWAYGAAQVILKDLKRSLPRGTNRASCVSTIDSILALMG